MRLELVPATVAIPRRFGRCQSCGRKLTVGAWPFCPHPPAAIGVQDDQLEGGARWFETMGHEPVWIESKSQWRREVAARDLVHVDRHDARYYARHQKQHDEHLRDTARDRA